MTALTEFKKIAQKQPEPKTQTASEETSMSKAERMFGMQFQDLTEELTDALGYARGAAFS